MKVSALPTSCFQRLRDDEVCLVFKDGQSISNGPFLDLLADLSSWGSAQGGIMLEQMVFVTLDKHFPSPFDPELEVALLKQKEELENFVEEFGASELVYRQTWQAFPLEQWEGDSAHWVTHMQCVFGAIKTAL